MITVKTDVLKGLAANALKGTSITPVKPICACINVKQAKGVLSLITMNEAGYYMENSTNVSGKDFDVIVNAAQFAGLVQKITSEEVSLEKVENTHLLLTSGSGKFKFELVYDVDGSELVFPKNTVVQNKKNQKKFKQEHLKSVYDLLNCAIGKVVSVEHYGGFFFSGKEAVTTDGKQLVSTKSDLFARKVIFPKALMELALLNGSKESVIDRTPGGITIIGDGFFLAGKTPTEAVINNFPMDKLAALFNTDLSGEVVLSKAELLRIVDRISLFTTADILPTMLFTADKKDGLIFSAQNTKGVEKLENLGDKKKFLPFTGAINIEAFRGLLNANPSEKVVLHYGAETCIKMTFEDTIQVLSLIVFKGS